MQIILVSAINEVATLSLVDAKRRLEESRAHAAAANEMYFEGILNLDPEDCSIDERIDIEMKLDQLERQSAIAWERYEKAVMRYAYEIKLAVQAGIVH